MGSQEVAWLDDKLLPDKDENSGQHTNSIIRQQLADCQCYALWSKERGN